MLKISIITINYNNLDGLIRTVESVVNQTWQEFEYIVIDGGSTDGSAEFIESQSDKIDYWVSEPDNGIYNAMNKGIAKTTGEYLLFLNSGDHLFDATVLEKYHQFVVGKDLIYFNLNFVDRFLNSRICKYPEQLSFSNFISGILPHQSTFIKRDLFTKFGPYDESLTIVSDWKFFMECVCKHDCTYLRIDETLSTFYSGGISTNPQMKHVHAEERLDVLHTKFRTYIDDINELIELRNIVLSLRKSRKIKLLIKLGMLNKF